MRLLVFMKIKPAIFGSVLMDERAVYDGETLLKLYIEREFDDGR